MIKHPLVYIEDILESIHAIQGYVTNLSEDDFYRSAKDQDAVIRRFLTIGEGASRLPDGFKDKYPDVPWREIVGMRHHLVHGYHNVKLDIVWETIQKSLPALKLQMEEILEKES